MFFLIFKKHILVFNGLVSQSRLRETILLVSFGMKLDKIFQKMSVIVW